MTKYEKLMDMLESGAEKVIDDPSPRQKKIYKSLFFGLQATYLLLGRFAANPIVSNNLNDSVTAGGLYFGIRTVSSKGAAFAISLGFCTLAELLQETIGFPGYDTKDIIAYAAGTSLCAGLDHLVLDKEKNKES